MWSFQFRRTITLTDWFKEIEKIKPEKVLVFCSSGNGKDPADDIADLNDMDRYTHKFYKPINENEYLPIPPEIIVTLPSKKNAVQGSAFKVKDIIIPNANNEQYNVEWLLKDGTTWRSDKIPTRGEFLIKFGQGAPMRPFSVILELEYPYLVEIKI